MERLDADICSLQSALEQTRKVLESVSVNLAVNVSVRVINDVVSAITHQTFVGLQFVSHQRGFRIHMLADFVLNKWLAPMLIRFALRRRVSHSHDDYFVMRPASHDPALMHVTVHNCEPYRQ